MKINIKNITLKNFKSIDYISLNFNGNTTLSGDNGVGKTTIFDGFMYALFDCDSKNRSAFAIKPLDNQGSEIPDLEHEVSILLEIDGKKLKLTSGIRDKWSSENRENRKFMGNEHFYKINGTAVTQTEYKRRVNEIAKEEILKLLTNTDYFCSLNWQEARKVLIDIWGNIPFSLLSTNPIAKEIDKQGYDNVLKAARDNISELKERLYALPIKREELNDSIINEDFSNLNDEIIKTEKRLEELKNVILGRGSKTKAETKKEIIEKRLFEIKNAFNIKKQAVQEDKINKINKAKLKLSSLNGDKIVYLERLSSVNARLLELKADIESTAALIIDLDSSEIDKSKLFCPMCGRRLIGELRIKKIAEFNQNREEKLKASENKLLALKAQQEELRLEAKNIQTEIENNNAEIEEYNQKLNEYKAIEVKEFQPDIEYKALTQELESLNFSEKEKLRAEYESCCEKLNTLNIQKFRYEQNQRIYKRIEKNMAEEKELKARLISAQKRLDTIQSLMRLKAEYIESEINSHFSIVHFKLFKQLINGNIEECCIPMVKGVPYRDLNSAMKINCGLDIINTLAAHFDIYPPVFIDNRESITRLLKSPCQIIGLAVEKDCNKITLKEVV